MRDELKTEREQLEGSSKKKQELEEELAAERDALSHEEDAIKRVRDEIEEHQAASKREEDAASTAQARGVAATEAEETLTNEIIDELRRRSTGLENEVAQERQRHQQQEDRLAGERTEAEALENRLLGLRTQRDGEQRLLTQEREYAEAELAHSKATAETLRNELQGEWEDERELQHQSQTEQAAKEDTQTQLTRLNEEETTLKEQIDAVKKAHAREIEEIRDQDAQLEREIGVVESAKMPLRVAEEQELEALRQQEGQEAEVEERIREIQEKISAARVEEANLEAEREDRLTSELHQQQLSRLRERLADLKRETEVLKNQRDFEIEEFETEEGSVQELKLREEALQNENTELRTGLATLREGLAREKHNREQANNELPEELSILHDQARANRVATLESETEHYHTTEIPAEKGAASVSEAHATRLQAEEVALRDEKITEDTARNEQIAGQRTKLEEERRENTELQNQREQAEADRNRAELDLVRSKATREAELELELVHAGQRSDRANGELVMEREKENRLIGSRAVATDEVTPAVGAIGAAEVTAADAARSRGLPDDDAIVKQLQDEISSQQNQAAEVQRETTTSEEEISQEERLERALEDEQRLRIELLEELELEREKQTESQNENGKALSQEATNDEIRQGNSELETEIQATSRQLEEEIEAGRGEIPGSVDLNALVDKDPVILEAKIDTLKTNIEGAEGAQGRNFGTRRSDWVSALETRIRNANTRKQGFEQQARDANTRKDEETTLRDSEKAAKARLSEEVTSENSEITQLETEIQQEKDKAETAQRELAELPDNKNREIEAIRRGLLPDDPALQENIDNAKREKWEAEQKETGAKDKKTSEEAAEAQHEQNAKDAEEETQRLNAAKTVADETADAARTAETAANERKAKADGEKDDADAKSAESETALKEFQRQIAAAEEEIERAKTETEEHNAEAEVANAQKEKANTEKTEADTARGALEDEDKKVGEEVTEVAQQKTGVEESTKTTQAAASEANQGAEKAIEMTQAVAREDEKAGEAHQEFVRQAYQQIETNQEAVKEAATAVEERQQDLRSAIGQRSDLSVDLQVEKEETKDLERKAKALQLLKGQKEVSGGCRECAGDATRLDSCGCEVQTLDEKRALVDDGNDVEKTKSKSRSAGKKRTRIRNVKAPGEKGGNSFIENESFLENNEDGTVLEAYDQWDDEIDGFAAAADENLPYEDFFVMWTISPDFTRLAFLSSPSILSNSFDVVILALVLIPLVAVPLRCHWVELRQRKLLQFAARRVFSAAIHLEQEQVLHLAAAKQGETKADSSSSTPEGLEQKEDADVSKKEGASSDKAECASACSPRKTSTSSDLVFPLQPPGNFTSGGSAFSSASASSSFTGGDEKCLPSDTSSAMLSAALQSILDRFFPEQGGCIELLEGRAALLFYYLQLMDMDESNRWSGDDEESLTSTRLRKRDSDRLLLELLQPEQGKTDFLYGQSHDEIGETTKAFSEPLFASSCLRKLSTFGEWATRGPWLSTDDADSMGGGAGSSLACRTPHELPTLEED
ncbi:unnamed protein product [Amoebophrya sp. A25]|nr:unnamed protein product [Amoebophrya sp. A25]|eukprot:GSA25T00003219001.1